MLLIHGNQRRGPSLVAPEKDFLVGYWVIDVPDEARAVEIAARISATPGPGGAPVNQPVEVRLITGPPPVEEI